VRAAATTCGARKGRARTTDLFMRLCHRSASFPQLWLRDHGAVACVWAMHLSLYRGGSGPAGPLSAHELALALERARAPVLPNLSPDTALVITDAPLASVAAATAAGGAGAAKDANTPASSPLPPPPPPLQPNASTPFAWPSNTAAAYVPGLDVRPPPSRPTAALHARPPPPAASAPDPTAQFGASLAALGDDLEARLDAIAQSLRSSNL
jgi:hypothetical protein